MKDNTSRFQTEFFVGNRARLRRLSQTISPIVITANGILQRGGDTTFPLHQDSSFWYLTGINEPDVLLVMDEREDYLIVPFREGVRAAFDGAIDPAELTARSGIKTILAENAGWERFGATLRQTKQIATIKPARRYVEAYGMYTNPARARLRSRLKELVSDLETIDISEHLVHQRMVKQPVELAAMQAAIDITIDSLLEISSAKKLSAYAFEYEIEADLTREFRRRGARGHAFEPIIGSGPRGAQIHHFANNSALSPDDVVVLDVGAEVEHYAADLTRTVALSAPSRRQEAIYTAVLEVQNYAMSLLKPGVFIRDYEKQVEQFMGKKLVELKLIKKADQEATRRYYPHATGHFLGLDVHDVGDYSLPLGENMVLTVEPGIYIPEEGIGVRIEDDVLVTKDGISVLSERLPRHSLLTD
jgi:Xaa-Pro aminopeptidase